MLFPSPKTRLLLIPLILCLLAAGQAQAKGLTILYTGETHGALYPCDCPLAPDGGVTRRATAIRKIRESTPNVLLLDSGGAFAGGMYDEHTQGEELDKARTETYFEAIKLMGYDALALGDEELGFGLDFLQSLGANFISANAVRTATGEPIVIPYITKEIDGVRLIVIGLTPPEAKNAVGEKLVILKPLDTLEHTLAQIKNSQKIDLIIVLSHLGEEMSRELLKQVPEINILINGHSKNSLETSERVGSSLLLQFSYQGRRLGRLDISLGEQNEIVDFQSQLIRMSDEIADDEAMAELLKGFNPSEELARVALDLYVMQGCPYCKDAEAVMRRLLDELGDRLDFKLYFLPDDDVFAKLDTESQIWLLILQHQPDKFWDYLDCRNREIAGMPRQKCAAKAGINIQQIEQGLGSGKGEELLRQNQAQAEHLRVSTTPTLFINHRPYKGKIEEFELTRYICRQLPQASAVPACEKLPECQNDGDCYKPGMVGSCESAGTRQAKCSYQPAVEIPLTVVQDEGAIGPEVPLIDWLRQLFPGIKPTDVSADSALGKQLISDYRLERLPAYLFALDVLEAKHIDQLKEDMVFVNDRLLLSPSASQAQVYIKRTPKPGRIEFLFSPLSPPSNKVLLDIYRILENEDLSVNFRLRYLVQQDQAGNLKTAYGPAELEEMRRQFIIRRDHADKFKPYLKLRSQNLDSSYWEQPLLDLGLEPYNIKKQAQSKAAEEMLIEEAQVLEGLEISPTPQFLINNRELIELQNRRQFKELLNRLQARKPAEGD